MPTTQKGAQPSTSSPARRTDQQVIDALGKQDGTCWCDGNNKNTTIKTATSSFAAARESSNDGRSCTSHTCLVEGGPRASVPMLAVDGKIGEGLA